MDNASIRENISEAKDDFGVLGKNSLDDLQFSPADWRQAAAVFAPKPGQNDGFYITDNAQGDVTIHNDLTSAKKEDATPYVQLLKNDAVGVAASGAGLVAGITATAAIATEGTAAVEGAALATSMAAGAAAVWPAIVIGTAIAAVAVPSAELLRTSVRQGEARDDVAHNQSFSFQSK